MKKEKCNLIWKTYSDHLRGMNHELYEMVKLNDLTDVTLICDDKMQFRLHKIILSACSPVFKKIISNLPQNDSVIYLRGIQSEEIQAIIEFIYLGETTFYDERVEEFFSVARNLEIKEVSRNFTSKSGVNDSKSPNLERENNTDTVADNYETSVPSTKDSTFTHLQYPTDQAQIEKENSIKIPKVTNLPENVPTDSSTTLSNNDSSSSEVLDEVSGEHVKCSNSTGIQAKIIEAQLLLTATDTSVESSDNTADVTSNVQNVKEKKFAEDNSALRKPHSYAPELNAGAKYDFIHNSKSSAPTKHVQDKQSKLCPQCGKVFSRPFEMKRHFEGLHKGVRYACHQCNFEAKDPRNLGAHVLLKHKGVKRPCDMIQYRASP